MEAQPSTEILHDFSPRILIYKDGRVERLRKDVIVPPSYDTTNRVHSKDVKISPGASARIYWPDDIPENTRLPILIYFHGGAYCQYSAFSSMYHTFLNTLVNEARVIAVSADYRLAPESPIPACYDDTWDITKWVISHSAGSGPDPWISQWADMSRVFLAGDSGGANMSHNMLAQAGRAGLLSSPARKVEGVVLVHPFFAHGELEEIVDFLSERKMGVLDPRFNPMTDPARMRKEVVCERMLVCVDKDDIIRERGILYYKALKETGWEGEVELLETNGGGHVFHLWDPTLEKAHEFVKVIASFINKNGVN
ncbi:putative carboxylesterase 13 [Silene latifolia]|uniref:putative carboxylesterase 13 n=1 Tax=Silene latifolia TaxID=37657 RepID=UPI003D772906